VPSHLDPSVTACCLLRQEAHSCHPSCQHRRLASCTTRWSLPKLKTDLPTPPCPPKFPTHHTAGDSPASTGRNLRLARVAATTNPQPHSQQRRRWSPPPPKAGCGSTFADDKRDDLAQKAQNSPHKQGFDHFHQQGHKQGWPLLRFPPVVPLQ